MSAQPRIFPRMVIHRDGVPVEVSLYRTGHGIEASFGGTTYRLTPAENERAEQVYAERDEWIAKVAERVEARRWGEEVGGVIYEDGIHAITRAHYDAIKDRVNWSTLKLMGKSPAHYREAVLNGGVDSDAKKRGRAVHMAVFEPEAYGHAVAVWDGGVRRGKAWDAFCAENNGRELLTVAEDEDARAVARAVRNHPGAARYLSGGLGEATMLWTHRAAAFEAIPGYEVKCKARVDFIAKEARAIVDLKTTTDASIDGFGRAAWRYGYHVQAAWYVDGYEAATGDRLPFVIVAVETTEPRVATVYVVPERILELGRETYRNLLDRRALCLTESRWPGYADEAVELELPRWAMNFSEDDDIADLGLVINQ